MKPNRTRYQAGSLTIKRRKSGLAVWVYRWREEEAPGKFTRRKQIVGTKEDFPNKAAAQRAVEGLRLEINVEVSTVRVLTVDELIEHYRHIELSEDNAKTIRTKQIYLHHLLKVISPAWGSYRLRDVKPFLVEAWLKKMTVAPGTRAKTKGVMNVLFQHAMRYEWATTNPILLVRQSAMPLREQIVLDPIEIGALLHELNDPSTRSYCLSQVQDSDAESCLA